MAATDVATARDNSAANSNASAGNESVGFCPACHNPVVLGDTHFRCAKCAFQVARVILQKRLPVEEVKLLLKDRKTRVISGFVSKKRANCQFNAMLVLDQGNRVQFAFE